MPKRQFRRTRLERERKTVVYQKRLKQSRDHLRIWEAHHSVALDDLVGNAAAVDEALAHYISHCHQVGVPEYVPRHALLALVDDHRQLRFTLPRAWDCLRSWAATLPWKPRTPFTFNVIQWVFLVAIDLANRSAGRRRYLFLLAGCLLRLAFFGLMRPAEFLNAWVRDYITSEQPDGQAIGLLAIAAPKTRAFFGRTQFACIRQEEVALWMRWALEGRGRSEKLWPSTGEKFRWFTRTVLAAAGLDGIGFSPGSCRPGGATYLFLAGVPVETIAFQGRWKALASLKSYIQEAASHMVWHDIPSAQAAKIRTALAAYRNVLLAPPPVPCTQWINGLSLGR